jgi:signal peptidase I
VVAGPGTMTPDDAGEVGRGTRARGVFRLDAATPTPPQAPPVPTASPNGSGRPAAPAESPSRSDRRDGTTPADGAYRSTRAAERARPRHRAVRTRRPMPFWQELPLLLLIALCLAVLIKTFLVQAFFIPSGSMENTLQVSDRVLVNKLVYEVRDPLRGEVIVFRGTDSWAPEGGVQAPTGLGGRLLRGLGELIGLAQPDERDFVKRVVGLPGDVVQCCDDRGRVTVNDHPLDEPYVFDNTPAEQRPFGPVNVPAGRLFVMGDHRHVSADSRQYLEDRWQGTVPLDQVIGRAFVKVWPTQHWGLLPAPKTFQSVPTALGPPQGDDGGIPPGVPAVVALPGIAAVGRRSAGRSSRPRRSVVTTLRQSTRTLWK